MNPLVSIILTSYNKPNSVGKAIESVINQTYPHWELFIMDDNSNEETVRKISKYIQNKKIYYINSQVAESERYKTTRYATLINEAIPRTKGKYLSYLTDDNIYLPNRLKIMVHYLEQNNKIDIVYSEQRVKICGPDQKVKNEFVRKAQGIQRKASGRVDHCSVMHTRRIAERIFTRYGSYWDDDPQYWNNGDAAFWNRLNQYQPFYPIPQVLDVAWKFPESFQRLYANVPKILPDGILVRGLSNEIYLIEQQKRRQISEEMMERLNYQKNQIVKIPDPFLFKYPEGDPVVETIFLNPEKFPNQRLIKSKDHPDIYFLQHNQKYRIQNAAVFKQFHFKLNEIVIVNEETLSNIPESSQGIVSLSNPNSILPDGTLWKCGSQFYLSFNNRLHPTPKEVILRLKLSVNEAVSVSPSIISLYAKGEPFTWAKKSL